MDEQLKADIEELRFAAGIADTFHGRNCCAALDRVEEALTKYIKLEQWQEECEAYQKEKELSGDARLRSANSGKL